MVSKIIRLAESMEEHIRQRNDRIDELHARIRATEKNG